MKPPDISVVVCTYNRAALLREALRSLFAQKAEDFSYEIIIIDNNSADDTPATVDLLKSQSSVPLRYVCESQQGNAFARNAGVEQAEASIIAFLDDDCTADENWLTTIECAFDRDPELDFVGGRVLPVWEGDPPSWLSTAHWAPLALLDYGTETLNIEGQTPRGLLTANIAIRKEVFDELGGFLPSLQRVKGSIGSMEDHEFLMRICRSGKRGLYLPDLITRARVDPERITKAYHRRWHTGHGHFYAVMRDPDWERSKFYLMGVPSHLYKETVTKALTWLSKILRGNSDAAFADECRLRFFYGFYRQRKRKPLKKG